MGISIQRAELLDVFLEALLCGLFVALYCVTTVILVKGEVACLRQSRKTLLVLSSSMLVIAITHLMINFARAMKAFLGAREVDEYYGNPSRPIDLVKFAFYVLQSLIGDAFMAWRCYIVHSKSKRIAVSAGALLVLMTAAGIGFIVELSRGGLGFDIFDTSHAWITIWFAFIMAVNISITLAITHRLVKTSNVSQVRRHVSALVGILIQSGALNTAGVISLFIIYLSGSNGLYVFLDICPQLVGIVFALVILQIHFRFGAIHPSPRAPPPAIITRRASRALIRDRLAQSPSRVFSPSLRRKGAADIHVDGSEYEYDRGAYPMHVTITEAVELFGDTYAGRGRETEKRIEGGELDDESMETRVGDGEYGVEMGGTSLISNSGTDTGFEGQNLGDVATVRTHHST